MKRLSEQRWREMHPDRLAAQRARWYQRHKEEIAAKRRAREKKLRGRDRPDKCDICGIATKVVWDHCHKTNAHRGWLCQNCNLALGLVRDDPDILQKMIVYLSKKPLAVLSDMHVIYRLKLNRRHAKVQEASRSYSDSAEMSTSQGELL